MPLKHLEIEWLICIKPLLKEDGHNQQLIVILSAAPAQNALYLKLWGTDAG